MKKNVKMKTLTLLSVLSVGVLSLGAAFVGNRVEANAAASAEAAFAMKAGASVRKDDPTGIRFSANMTADKYNAIVKDDDSGFEENVSVGMIIVAAKYFDEFDAQTAYTDYYEFFSEEKGQLIDLPFAFEQIALDDETGRYYYNGAITEISDVTRTYRAVGYIKTGDVYEYTANVSDARSAVEVAKMAIVDNGEDRLTVKEAETIGEAYGVEYIQLDMPEAFTVTDSDGETLLSDSRLLEAETLTLEFDYGYAKKAVVTANGTQIATAVGAGKLLYPVSADVTVKAEATDVAYNYNANGTTGTLSVGSDGFMALPGSAKWGTVYAETWQAHTGLGDQNRIISFEMKTSDLAAYLKDTANKFNEMGFMFGSNNWKPAIGTVAADGDAYKLTFNAAASSLTASVSQSAETFTVTFVSPSTTTNEVTRNVSVYIDGVKIGETSGTANSGFGMWFDTRNTTYSYAYRYSYCASEYAVFDEVVKKYTVTAASGMTVAKEDGTLTDQFASGENAIISYDYGYSTQAVIKANGTQIATVVGSGKLKYPVTEDVAFSVETTAIASHAYGGTVNDSDSSSNGTSTSGTVAIGQDGYMSLPTKIKWGNIGQVDQSTGNSATSRITSMEMKVSELAAFVAETKKITQFGLLLGDNDAKIGFCGNASNVKIDGDDYVITLWSSGCTNASAELRVPKTADTFKLSFVTSSTKATEEARTIDIYLDGVKAGSAKATSADAALAIWFYLGNYDVSCRYSYCLSDYGVI